MGGPRPKQVRHPIPFWIRSPFAIEDRFADYDTARVSANAVALAAAKIDVIVAFSLVPARAAREATSSIPIVMDTGDPVRQGLVASLARSGNNVTGQSLMRQDMAAEQLQTLREAIPEAIKIAVLQQPDVHLTQMAEIERAAVGLGASVLAVPAGVVQDLPHLFNELKEAGVDAYLVLNEPRTDAVRGKLPRWPCSIDYPEWCRTAVTSRREDCFVMG